MQREIMKQTMARLLEKGADKVALWMSEGRKEEFNIMYKELSLLRSVETQGLTLIVLKDQKQASTRINQFDEASINKAIDDVMLAVESSNADPAFDISPVQTPAIFDNGPATMDVDKVVLRMNELIDTMKQDFPCIQYDSSLSFSKASAWYLNSNGVDYEENSAQYSFMIMFTAKIGTKMSSFNYTGFEMADLDKPLIEQNFTRELLEQITEQTECKPFPVNFTGDVILFPFVAGDLLESLISQHFGDSGLLTNSSLFPDHLEQKILDEKLSVYNKPQDPSFADKNFVTHDGFLAVDAPIVENGVLKNYPIGLFTANKVNKKRTMGNESNLVMTNGEISLAEMIGSVKEGVLCMRASFGSPNAKGDLSAVLKNSYYIKDGKVQYPINESMMSINIIDVFKDITSISKETINTGNSIFPYLQFGGASISRK